jgi:ribosomal protein S18 acetylase RimI-like enzyme
MLKALLFGLLGKDPEAVVVTFFSGDERLARRMFEEFRGLVPERRHYVVTLDRSLTVAAQNTDGVTVVLLEPGAAGWLWLQLRRHFRALRVAQAAVLFGPESEHAALRWAAWWLAPRKILAYNIRLERHHLRAGAWIASLLFLKGVPLDRIWLRPWFWPGRKERSVYPSRYRTLEGRAVSSERRPVAVLAPYFPYPMSHGGAVRIFHLLREASRDFDIFLFAFTEGGEEPGPVLEFCARAILVPLPRYREPRWSTLQPPEARQYDAPLMGRLIEEWRAEHKQDLLQVEYTYLAGYGGDVLVEHDVTFDLYAQVHERHGTVSSWWDWWRWRRYECRALGRFRRIVVMSEKDRILLSAPHAAVIANGVNLERFRPEPESSGARLLFIGSFRHFPNIAAYRFFVGEVWPLVRDSSCEASVTVVAGPDPFVYAPDLEPPADTRIRLLEFVRDVRPLYVDTNLVIVPTVVSAGTNLKVLEAMAMERAIVSTPSGCAGLGLVHGESVWMAETPRDFALGVERLLGDAALRRRIATNARARAEECFDWRQIGALQGKLWRELLHNDSSITVRPGFVADLEHVARIQSACPEAASWLPADYLAYDLRIASINEMTAGFLASRETVPGEIEVLNLAVEPGFRRRGVARALLGDLLRTSPGTVFLEVRASNTAARNLYKAIGFREIGHRPAYYDQPAEPAIVMRLGS